MARSLVDHVEGALFGLAIGEALATRTDGGPLVHGTATTWTLAVVESLLARRPGEPLKAPLALRLELLTTMRKGAALRGRAGAALADVARQGPTSEVAAAGMVAALPLAFALGDDDASTAKAIRDVVAVTHRHPRVIAAAAAWVGGLRAAFAQPRASADDVFDAAVALADRALLRCAEDDPAARDDVLEARGAIAIARAAAAGAGDGPDEVAVLLDELLPAGFDTTDAPERVAFAALAFSRLDPKRAASSTNELARREDGAVLAAVCCASFGARHGAAHLPLGLVGRLAARASLAARARRFAAGDHDGASLLVEEELRLAGAGAAVAVDDSAVASDDVAPTRKPRRAAGAATGRASRTTARAPRTTTLFKAQLRLL